MTLNLFNQELKSTANNIIIYVKISGNFLFLFQYSDRLLFDPIQQNIRVGLPYIFRYNTELSLSIKIQFSSIQTLYDQCNTVSSFITRTAFIQL